MTGYADAVQMEHHPANCFCFWVPLHMEPAPSRHGSDYIFQEGRGFVVGPHTCRMLLTTGGAALLIVHVEHTLLEDALAGLLGGASATPLVFEPVIDFRRAETAGVVAMLH